MPISAYWKTVGGTVGLAVLVVPIVLVGSLMLKSSPTTYTVEAVSEVVEVEVDGQTVPRWVVSGARVRVDAAEQGVGEQFQVQISPQSSLRFERIGLGPLLIVARGNDGGRAATLFDLGEREFAVASELALQLQPSQGQVVLLPFAGEAKIGDTLYSQTHGASPILRSGRVRLLGQTLLRSGRFQAGGTSLEAGDRFEVKAKDFENRGGSGFIRMDDAPGFEVVYRAEGREGLVSRFGSPGYRLAPSLWARLTSDPLPQAVFAIWAALIPIALAILELLRTSS